MWGKRASSREERAASQCMFESGHWTAPGRCACGRRPVLLRGPTCQSQSTACPLPLHSLALTFLASSGTALRRSMLRECVRHARGGGELHGVSYPRAFPLNLGPRSPRRGSVDQLSPHCQGLQAWGLCQREGKSNWTDGQALARPAAPANPGENEAHHVPRSGLPPSPLALMLGSKGGS